MESVGDEGGETGEGGRAGRQLIEEGRRDGVCAVTLCPSRKGTWLGDKRENFRSNEYQRNLNGRSLGGTSLCDRDKPFFPTSFPSAMGRNRA